MAEKKLRVHNLAKELLVKSATIIEKCRAEGIEIKNHMHVVSAGLEATVREWFSEGAHSTTLEESQRVDLSRVRVKVKKKKAATKAEVVAETGVAVAEAPPESVETAEAASTTQKITQKKAKAPTQEEPAEEFAAEAGTDVAVAAPAEPVSAPTAAEVETAAEKEEPAAPGSAPVEAGDAAPPSVAASAPEAPPKLVVAGPQNIPRPAQLSGPKVVRIERPDYVAPPRPARPSHRPPKGPEAPPTGDESSEESRKRHGRAPVRGRGREGVKDAGAAAGKRVHPRRSQHDTRDVVNEKLREWRDRDLIERRERLEHASGRGIGGLRAIEGKQPTRRTGVSGPRIFAKKSKVELVEPITVKGFSRETGIQVNLIIKQLMAEGLIVGMNSDMASDKAQLIAMEHGIELTVVKAKSALDRLGEEYGALAREHPAPRPPVVTVLGHVDHGKTSLLDRIRKTSVAKGEAGGITQHIGAYRVRVGDQWVAFLDTPGHAAFTAMRARGANLTDVVVLVVAADDGVMPTTIEAINHAKAAETTIVVALNKIDLPHDLNKIYGQLAEQDLTPSGEWGGHTDVIKTSAVTGEGIEDLLAHLATLSEVLELQADATIPASGTVIEAERSGSLGNIARVLVQEGTLRAGDILVCGAAYGRVRVLRDESGRRVDEAGPSTPVEVTGLSEVPQAGDRFYVMGTSQKAKAVAEDTAVRLREQSLIRAAKPTSLETALACAQEGELPELNVILRADVQGSVDVLKKELTSFPSDQVRLTVLHAGVGVVTESDIALARASAAIIISFHVVPDPKVNRMAEDAGVSIRSYRVIYEVIDDIRKALEGLLEPEEKAELRGRAEVREVFSITRVGKVAGCFIQDGLINRSHQVRVVRDGVLVREASAIESLRRFKDDVKEVKSGFECGLRIDGFDDLKPGDILEAFEVVKIAQKLAPTR